jgi:peroxiredoxin
MYTFLNSFIYLYELMTTLTEQLAAAKAGSATRIPAERRAVMEAATDLLRASGIEKTAKQVGQHIPDVTLTNAHYVSVQLKELVGKALTIIVFYRGGWCPYCNLELKAWQAALEGVKAQGAQLVAITPETPDNSLTTAEKNALTFEVLSDPDLAAATAFGLTFDFPADLVEVYKGFGLDLPKHNGNGRWSLPVAATYVVAQDGTIRYAYIDADYRNRAEPSDVLKAVGL